MKKLLTLIALTITLNTAIASNKSTALFTNPVLLGAGYYNGQIEKKVSEKWTMGLEFAHYSADALIVSAGFTAVGIKAQRHFFGKAMEDSMYLSASAYAVKAKIGLFGMEASGVGPGVGATIGYQWVWDSVILKVGGGYSYTAPYADFQVGIRF